LEGGKAGAGEREMGLLGQIQRDQRIHLEEEGSGVSTKAKTRSNCLPLRTKRGSTVPPTGTGENRASETYIVAKNQAKNGRKTTGPYKASLGKGGEYRVGKNSKSGTK